MPQPRTCQQTGLSRGGPAAPGRSERRGGRWAPGAPRQRSRPWMPAALASAGLAALPACAWAASEGGHGGGGFISLDKSLIIQLVNFLILLILLQKVLYKPIL